MKHAINELSRQLDVEQQNLEFYLSVKNVREYKICKDKIEDFTSCLDKLIPEYLLGLIPEEFRGFGFQSSIRKPSHILTMVENHREGSEVFRHEESGYTVTVVGYISDEEKNQYKEQLEKMKLPEAVFADHPYEQHQADMAQTTLEEKAATEAADSSVGYGCDYATPTHFQTAQCFDSYEELSNGQAIYGKSQQHPSAFREIGFFCKNGITEEELWLIAENYSPEGYVLENVLVCKLGSSDFSYRATYQNVENPSYLPDKVCTIFIDPAKPLTVAQADEDLGELDPSKACGFGEEGCSSCQ